MGVKGKPSNNLGKSMKKANTKKSVEKGSTKSISPKKTDKFLNLPSSAAGSELSEDNSSCGQRPDSSSSKFLGD